jgi:hypothetical protein
MKPTIQSTITLNNSVSIRYIESQIINKSISSSQLLVVSTNTEKSVLGILRAPLFITLQPEKGIPLSHYYQINNGCRKKP